MQVSHCLLMFLWLLMIPLGIGFLPTRYMKGSASLSMSLLSGYAVCFGISQILILPCIYLDVSLHTLAFIWQVMMGILALVGILLACLKLPELCHEYKKKIFHFNWFVLGAILLVLVQIFVVVYFAHFDADDSFYVGTATTAVAEDSVFQINPYTGEAYESFPSRYVLSPFPILLAIFSVVTNVHPAVVAHVALPAAFMILAYAVYIQIGRFLFPKDRKAASLFVCFVCLVQICSNFSVYTAATFSMFRLWQGKAVLASVLLPAIFLISGRNFQGKEKKGDWVILFMLALSSCLVSSMGIMLAPIMIGSMAFVLGVCKWKWKSVLYAAVCCIPCVALAVCYLLIR